MEFKLHTDLNVKTYYVCVINILSDFVENLTTRHVDLFWNVDFANKTVSGEAVLRFDIVANEIEQIVSTQSQQW